MSQIIDNVNNKINQIEPTNDCLTGRAGLSLVSCYLRTVNITKILSSVFSFVKKSSKGISLINIFHQLICFFFDGSNYSMSHFDILKKDNGYAASIELSKNQLLSSHAAKRFFKAFSIVRVWLFRKVLKRLFLWRLKIVQPEVIKIGLDTMVMDNDEAVKREGVDPTYKKVKGFQPLQMYWGRFIIDAIFRRGKAHSNHGNHVIFMLRSIVNVIREKYNKDVPIILIADTGFFDNKLFQWCDKNNVGFVVGGKMYCDIKDRIISLPDKEFSEYKRNRKTWLYCDFQDKRKSWKTDWRLVYTKPLTDDEDQILLEFERPETIIYSNLGMENKITEKILEVKDVLGTETTISSEAIITAYHMRGADELTNRGFKDFGTEQLPFKRFEANTAYYYMMMISFFLFETFKIDIDSETIPIEWYAKTFRRRCLDIAGKIIKTGKQLIMKITEAVYNSLRFDHLWEKSVDAIPIGLK